VRALGDDGRRNRTRGTRVASLARPPGGVLDGLYDRLDLGTLAVVELRSPF